MRKGIRLGLVGCGRWGRFILRDLVALGSDVTVAARSATSSAAALEGGAANVVETVGDLPEIEGIVVATPTQTHAEVVERALEHGVPVFVEKPLTDDLAAADRLAEAAPDRLFVMDKWRYHPGVELLAALAHDRSSAGSSGCARPGSAGETRTRSTRAGSSCRTSSRSGSRSSLSRLCRGAPSPTPSTDT